MLRNKPVNLFFAILLIVAVGMKATTGLNLWWIGLLLFLWLAITVYGAYQIRLNYFLPALHQKENPDGNVVALTFDDGPNSDFTPRVIDLLRTYQQQASFFCIGKNIEEHPGLLQKLHNEGHLIGNHSYTHQNTFGFLSTAKVIEDLKMCNEAIYRILGVKPRFFRPPFGVTNPNISRAVKKMKLTTFGWCIRSFDTVAKDPEKVYRKIVKEMKSGSVILLHDTSALSVEVLEKVLRYMQQNKIRSVRLDTLFNLQAYE